MANLWNIEDSSKILQVEEDVRNNIFPFFGLCSGLRGHQRPSFTSGQILPPPGPEACPKSPALTGLIYPEICNANKNSRLTRKKVWAQSWYFCNLHCSSSALILLKSSHPDSASFVNRCVPCCDQLSIWLETNTLWYCISTPRLNLVLTTNDW